MPNRREVLFTDTVGFIQKLPTDLVAAFKATLEEVQEADLLLHVLDATRYNGRDQMEAVHEILEDLGAMDKPKVLALNKVDQLEPDALRALLEEELVTLPDGRPHRGAQKTGLKGARGGDHHPAAGRPGRDSRSCCPIRRMRARRSSTPRATCRRSSTVPTALPCAGSSRAASCLASNPSASCRRA